MYSSLFYPFLGGSERQAQLLARELVRRGHIVEVVTQGSPGLARHERVEGVLVRRELVAVGRGAGHALAYLASSLRSMLRDRRRSQILHVHHIYMDAFMAGLLRGRLKMPVIVKAACGGSVGDMARLSAVPLSRCVFRVTRRIDRVIAISGQIQEELIAHGYRPARIERIPNAVDVRGFCPTDDPEAAKRALGLTGRVVTFVGRLVPQKGLLYLLEAWREVVVRYPDAMLLLLGKGSQEAELRVAAAQLGVAGQVSFLGERQDPRPYLAASDALVLPSIAEGMSNVLLEAMAMGLPCVATRVGGTLDVIRDGVSGVLVEPRDPLQLARGLLGVLEDREWAGHLGKRARRVAEESFSLESVVDRYIALYRRLLEGGGALPT
jgi:L-malate glycosyltransferase